MQYLNLTDSQLCEVILDFEINGHHVDLHNDFDCYKVEYNPEVSLTFYFKGIKDQIQLQLIFSQPSIINSNFNLDDLAHAITLTNFQRARLLEHDELKEVSSDGLKDYLIEFEEGQSVELLAEEVKLVWV